ncbi:MAG: response regulator, partial [Pseudomonadota bacterium]
MIIIQAKEPECDPSLAVALERAGLAFRFAETEEALCDVLDGPEGGAVEAVAIDLGSDPEKGVENLKAFTRARPEPRIIAFAARASLAIGVAAMKAGADDFLPAPVAPARLLTALAALPQRTAPHGGGGVAGSAAPALATVGAGASSVRRRGPAPAADGKRMFDALIIESPAMRD